MNLHQTARSILARRGLAVDDLPAPQPFNPGQFLAERAQEALSMVIPPRFADAEPDHPQVREWVRLFTAAPAAAPSLLLLGPVGTGKTHQAYGALKQAVLAACAQSTRITWAVTSHPDFNADMRPAANDTHLSLFAHYTSVDLLMFDDLGAGKATDWTADTLYRLVDHRWANQKPMIVTTNLAPPLLRSTVGDRVVSRLADGTRVDLQGHDRRRDGSR